MGIKIEEEVVECYDSWGVPIGKFVSLKRAEQYARDQVAAALEDVAKRIEAAHRCDETQAARQHRTSMREAARIVSEYAKEQDHG